MNKQINIGNKVRLKEDLETSDCYFTKGHIFEVISQYLETFILIDNYGNTIEVSNFNIFELIN